MLGDKEVKEKSQSNLRWLILILNCVMMMGCYYAGDIPAALYQPLKDYMGSPGNYDTLFSLLYTIYSIPNVILPFFGGFFIDKLGIKICLITFAALIALGQAVFAIGVNAKSWPVMFLGRFIFGCGAESLSVGQGATLSQWFKGKEVAFAFGVSLSIARLGSVINNFISPTLATKVSVPFSLWFGVILCGCSFFSAFCIGFISKSFENNQEKNKVGGLLGNAINESEVGESDDSNNNNGDDNNAPVNNDIDANTASKTPSVKLSDALSFISPFWVLTLSCVIVYGCVLPFNNIASALLLERNYFVANPQGCHLVNTSACESSFNQPDYAGSCIRDSRYLKYQPPLPEYIRIDDQLYDPLKADDIDCTSSTWKDKDSCTYNYCKNQHEGISHAATAMSIPYIISAVLSPFLGAFVDKFGMRAIVATIAPATLIIVHAVLGYSVVDPIGPLVGQGLAYSAFAAVLWPSVPLVCEQKFIGLGYGIVTSVQNIGLAVFPVIIAALYSANGDLYLPNSESFFVALACAGFVIGLYLNYYDYYYYGNVFNLPSSKVSDDDYSPLADEEDNSRAPTERIKAEGKSRSRTSSGSKARSASEDAKRDSEGEIAVEYDNPMLAGSK